MSDAGSKRSKPEDEGGGAEATPDPIEETTNVNEAPHDGETAADAAEDTTGSLQADIKFIASHLRAKAEAKKEKQRHAEEQKRLNQCAEHKNNVNTLVKYEVDKLPSDANVDEVRALVTRMTMVYNAMGSDALKELVETRTVMATKYGAKKAAAETAPPAAQESAPKAAPRAPPKAPASATKRTVEPAGMMVSSADLAKMIEDAIASKSGTPEMTVGGASLPSITPPVAAAYSKGNADQDFLTRFLKDVPEHQRRMVQ